MLNKKGGVINMYYNDMLLIANNNSDSMFVALAIFAFLLVVYAIGFSKIAEKRERKLKEAKVIAVEMLDVINSKKEDR